MEPDPPRFPLRKLVKYVVMLVLLWGGFTYRTEIMALLRESFAKFEQVMGPPRDAPPPRSDVVPPPLEVVPPTGNAPVAPMAPDGVVDRPPSAGAKPLVQEEEVPPENVGDNDGDVISEPSRARPVQEIGNGDNWVVWTALPEAARKRSKRGRVVMNLTITTQGRAKNCRIVQRSGEPEMDRSICRQMIRNARFRPALDDDGRPIEHSWTHTISWTP